MSPPASKIYKFTFFRQIALAVNSDWLKTIVCSELAALHDCYIIATSNNFKAFMPIGPDVPLTEYKSDYHPEVPGVVRSFSADE